MSKGIFNNAIAVMQSQQIAHYGPVSFQQYIREQNLSVKGTAQYISIQSRKDLQKELSENNIMVLRLGKSKDSQETQFALINVKDGWDDFFIDDQKVFHKSSVQDYFIDWEADAFLPYKVLPKLTETAYVNLALSSGLLQKALNLDKPIEGLPITNNSTYTFSVKPFRSREIVLEHRQGQVEFDAVFIGYQEGEKKLFVLEAKHGTKLDSLSKLKLLYPVLALQTSSFLELPIVPVYMRTISKGKDVMFHIAECLDVKVASNLTTFEDIIVDNAKVYKINVAR